MSTIESERRDVRKAMISGVRWLATARMIAQVSSWIITLIVIRLLTPADYGLQAMVAVIYSLITLITHSGIDRAIARHPDLGEKELRQIFGFSLTLNTTVMILVWLAAPYVAAYYQEEAVVVLLRTLAVGFVITVFKTVPIGLVWRNLNYRSHAIANLIGTVSGSLTTLVLAILGYGVWALLLGMLMSRAASAIFLQLSTRWFVMPRFGIAAIRPLVRYAWTISFGFFVWTFAWQLDILIGDQRLSAEVLGFYVVAINLCGLPLAKVVPLANEVLYPAYAKLQTDSAAVSKYFEKSIVSLCFTLFPSFLGLAAISKWLVPVLFGPKWVGIEQVMMIVALAMPFRVVLSMCNPMLNATGNAMTSLSTGVFAIVLIGVAMIIGVQWGVVGLALAGLAVSPVLVWVVVWRTKATSGISFGFLIAKVGPTLAISAIMAVLVYLVGLAVDDLLPDAGVFSLQVFVGFVLYTLLAAIFTRDLLLATIDIVRTSLKKNQTVTKTSQDADAVSHKLLKKWVNRASPGGSQTKLLILKYHRADNSVELSLEGRSGAIFEAQAGLLAKTFNTLTVADAARRIKDGTLPPRALCITFDDGYADNFNIALPILKQRGLTATFFVPSGLSEETIIWSDQIANVFATAGKNSGKVRSYLADAGLPTRYTELMNKLKYMSVDAQENIVHELSAFGSTTDESSKLMSSEQIREMTRQGMEVGGHTVNHIILSNVDDDRARHEISDCKTQLEAIIDMPVVSFAYPNGRRGRDYSERDVRMVREAGFETAVNTEFGLAGNNENLFEMPRVAQYFVTPSRLFRMYL